MILDRDDVDLSQIPVVAQLATVGSLLFDVALNSGDLIFSLLWGLLSNIQIVAGIVSALVSLSGSIPWLPADTLTTVSEILIVVVLILYLQRLFNSLRADTS